MDNKINFAEFDKGLIFKGHILGATPKKIVVHNSASAGDAYSAANYNYTQTVIKGKNTGFAHYYVDDKNVIMLARENWIAWHSGKNEINKISIGIEICCNPMACLNQCTLKTCAQAVTAPTELCAKNAAAIRKFKKAEKNALDLVYTLITKWSLKEEDVLFHSEVKNTACPYFTKKLHNIYKGFEFFKIVS